MSLYTLWLFIWDDDIDESDGQWELSKLDSMHKTLLEWVSFRLGLTEGMKPGVPGPPLPTANAGIFNTVARDMKLAFHEPGRRRFFDELKFYLDSLLVEQGFLLRRELPSVQTYWDHRLGTSAVHTYSAAAEYMMNGVIPEELFGTDENNTLWYETNRFVVWYVFFFPLIFIRVLGWGLIEEMS